MEVLAPPPSTPAELRKETATTRVASSGVVPRSTVAVVAYGTQPAGGGTPSTESRISLAPVAKMAAGTHCWLVAAAPPATATLPALGAVPDSVMEAWVAWLRLPAGSMNCANTVFGPSP